MKKALTLTAGLMLVASMAMAQSGVNLNVSDALGCGSLANAVSNTCTANTGSFIVVGSVASPRDLVQFVASGQILDIQSSAAALPDWWHLDVCRTGKFSLTFDGTAASCGTVWDANSGPAPLSVAQWQYNAATPNRIRLNMGAAVASPYDNAIANAELGVFKLTITKALTTGTGACAGCATGACIVLNEVNLQEVGVLPYITVTNALSNNFVTYNSGAGIPACPASTPTQNKSWGAVKALYR
jgi:hypothetical protein